MTDEQEQGQSVAAALARVRHHDFHPLNLEGAMTIDRMTRADGVAELGNTDSRERLLAIRDLVSAGSSGLPAMFAALGDDNFHVRQVCAAALGVLGLHEAVVPLHSRVVIEKSSIVRSQIVTSLGQIGSPESISLLQDMLGHDPSSDVVHQCELAIDRIQKSMGVTQEFRNAFEHLKSDGFGRVKEHDSAPDFTLADTEGRGWNLSEFRGKKWVLLIWIFADWCPVCHGEFQDLINLRQGFEQANVQVFTLECNDLYRGRVMVGRELEPNHWFAEKPFTELYTNGIWWPHLLDHAGVIGAKYGIDPMAFAVHSEFVNRPSTVVIDPAGQVRFAHFGQSWSDRPSLEKVLGLIQTGVFEM